MSVWILLCLLVGAIGGYLVRPFVSGESRRLRQSEDLLRQYQTVPSVRDLGKRA